MKIYSFDKSCYFEITSDQSGELLFKYEDKSEDYCKSWRIFESKKLQDSLTSLYPKPSVRLAREIERQNFTLVKNSSDEICFEAVFIKDDEENEPIEKIISVNKNMKKKKWFICIWTNGVGRLATAPRSISTKGRQDIWTVIRETKEKIISEGFQQI